MHLNTDFFFSSKRRAEVQKEIVPVKVLLVYLNSKEGNKYPMPKSEEEDLGCLYAVSSSSSNPPWDIA